MSWLDKLTLLISMPGADMRVEMSSWNLAGTVAYNVDTGKLWRGPKQ